MVTKTLAKRAVRSTKLVEATPRLTAKEVREIAKPKLLTAAEHYAKHEMKLYIETRSGKRFFIEHPEFDIGDITHALAHQCRYTGHSKVFYSVAEHSVLVSTICAQYNLGDPFEGLMHDAAEAYLSDIAAPWKALLPDYKKLEAKIELPLRKHWGLPVVLSDGVKRADWLALFIEARSLIPSGAADWIAPEGIKEQAANIRLPVLGLSPGRAALEFTRAYKRLNQRSV
jgi:uncharacterized protein